MYTKHTVVDGNAFSVFAEFDDLPDDAPEDLSTVSKFNLWQSGSLHESLSLSVNVEELWNAPTT